MSKSIQIIRRVLNSGESEVLKVNPPAGCPRGLGRFGVWLRFVDHRGKAEDAIFQLSQVDGPDTANDRRVFATGSLRAGDTFEVHLKADDDPGA
jgi:hypothetical protein